MSEPNKPAPSKAAGGWIGFCQAMSSQRQETRTRQMQMKDGNDHAK